MAERELAQIMKDEGFQPSVYLDSLGNKTVGYGFNLERAGVQKVLNAAGINKSASALAKGEAKLNKEEARKLVKAEFPYYTGVAKRYVGKDAWDNLSENRRGILTNMAYNLGAGSLSEFKKLKAAIKAGDWDTAQQEMEDSDWYGQVGSRADKLIARMGESTEEPRVYAEKDVGILRKARNIFEELLKKIERTDEDEEETPPAAAGIFPPVSGIVGKAKEAGKGLLEIIPEGIKGVPGYIAEKMGEEAARPESMFPGLGTGIGSIPDEVTPEPEVVPEERILSQTPRRVAGEGGRERPVAIKPEIVAGGKDITPDDVGRGSNLDRIKAASLLEMQSALANTEPGTPEYQRIEAAIERLLLSAPNPDFEPVEEVKVTPRQRKELELRVENPLKKSRSVWDDIGRGVQKVGETVGKYAERGGTPGMGIEYDPYSIYPEVDPEPIAITPPPYKEERVLSQTPRRVAGEGGREAAVAIRPEIVAGGKDITPDDVGRGSNLDRTKAFVLLEMQNTLANSEPGSPEYKRAQAAIERFLRSVPNPEFRGGGIIGPYAVGGPVVDPRGIAALGRGPDTELVHMTPGEVRALQRLAESHGGSLTINPKTGLPESAILGAVLPALAGLAAGSLTTMPIWATALGIGLTTKLITGDWKKGIAAGISGASGAGLGRGLVGAGTTADELAKTSAKPNEFILAKAKETGKEAALKSGPYTDIGTYTPKLDRGKLAWSGVKNLKYMPENFMGVSGIPRFGMDVAGMVTPMATLSSKEEFKPKEDALIGSYPAGAPHGFMAPERRFIAPQVAASDTSESIMFAPSPYPNPMGYEPLRGGPSSWGYYGAKGGIVDLPKYQEGGEVAVAPTPDTSEASYFGSETPISDTMSSTVTGLYNPTFPSYMDSEGIASVAPSGTETSYFPLSRSQGYNMDVTKYLESLDARNIPRMTGFSGPRAPTDLSALSGDRAWYHYPDPKTQDPATNPFPQGVFYRPGNQFMGGGVFTPTRPFESYTPGGSAPYDIQTETLGTITSEDKNPNTPWGSRDKTYGEYMSTQEQALRGRWPYDQYQDYMVNMSALRGGTPATPGWRNIGPMEGGHPRIPGEVYDIPVPTRAPYGFGAGILRGTPKIDLPRSAGAGPGGTLLPSTRPGHAFMASPSAVRRQFGESPLLHSPIPLTPEEANLPNLFGSGQARYFNEGGLTAGPGDGMSDDIMTTISGVRPAALSPGEFVVPADVVSGVGNGDTKAGAKRLYAMMNRVREARTGKTSQPREINPRRMLPR